MGLTTDSCMMNFCIRRGFRTKELEIRLQQLKPSFIASYTCVGDETTSPVASETILLLVSVCEESWHPSSSVKLL